MDNKEKLDEIIKEYGHLFNVVYYNELKWYQKLIRYIKNKYFWKVY